MTEPRRFDEQTRWDSDPGGLRAGGAGWTPPGASEFIDRADPYWGGVLEKARVAYGDPNMHFDTDRVGEPRALVFGDGTPVPADGALAYRNSGTGTTYLLNTDGTVSAQAPNGIAGQPVAPAGFRRGDDGQFAPVDAHGQQIAPLLGTTPAFPYGYHDHLGTLTPKNARGDYYVDDPVTGERRYYTAGGDPITDNDFGGTDPAPAEPLPTEEQQSGRAADAVRKLHEDMAARYSDLSTAEGTLSEVLLQAHATTADGQHQLQQIQQKIVEAVNNPALSLDTPAGEQAFLKFLRGQVAAIGDVVSSGTLSADDQAKAVDALSNLYAVDPGTRAGEPAGDAPATTPPASPTAPAEAAVPVDLGPVEAMPDPTLSDLGLADLGAGSGGDPLASLASALPGALGSVPPGLGGDPFGQLAGATAPLAGLISQLGETARRGENTETLDETDESDEPEPEPDGEVPAPPAVTAAPPEPAPVPPPAPEIADTESGAPVAADVGPPPAPTTVALPDGSTANAKTAEVARAVTSHLSGTPVEQAFRDAGIELPPPGTPVTDPIDPSALSCGGIGMFADRYVVALSSVKALQDGEVVPLSSVASSPDFLGWMDPSRNAAPAVPSHAG